MIQFEDRYKKLADGCELNAKQIEGVNFLLARKGAILSLQTGLGKTITVLTTAKIILDNYDSARVVIVCPVKAKKAFKSEIRKRMAFPKDYVGYIATDEMDFDIDTNRIFLFTDTNIKKYNSLVKDIYDAGHKIVLFVDEAHSLADKKSGFYNVMSEVRTYSTLVYLVSATPLINNLDGLYNIVNFACPGFLGKKTDFDNLYTIWHLDTIYVKGGARKKVKTLDGYKNLDALNQRLKQVLIVRGKEYNLKFGKQFKDMTPEESIVYDKVSSGILGSKGSSEERNFSKRMHDLQRFIDRSYDGDAEIKELAKEYGASDYSTKEETLIEAIKAAMKKDFSIIVFASYKDTIKRLHNVLRSRRVELGLGRIYEITGDIDLKTRERVEDRITKNDVILISTAGSESINLQKCNCVIFYDIPFSVKSIIQVIGRVCRIDTKHSTQYIIFCGVKDTIDEYKFALMQMHLGAVQRSINVGEDIPFSDMGIDNKLISELREKLLWKYRGDPFKKKLRKIKKELKEKIKVATVQEADSIIASNKFLIEPVDLVSSEIKSVKVLYPDIQKYESFLNGKLPFTALRSSYMDYLKSDKGKEIIKKLQFGIMKSAGDFVIVGNTNLTEVLKQEILDQFIV